MLDKTINIAKNPNYDRYQRGLSSMVYIFLQKISGNGIENHNISNKELAEELHKLLIRTFKQKVHSSFADNIWGPGIADMELIRKVSKGIRFYHVLLIFSVNTQWVIPLKDKKGITTTNVFQKILDEFSRKPNKIWADKGSKFYIKSMKSLIEINGREIYSTHTEEKPVVERFIRTLKNKIYKCLISISKNVYIDKYNINKYNNLYYNRTIKMKPVDVNPSMYMNLNKGNNK